MANNNNQNRTWRPTGGFPSSCGTHNPLPLPEPLLVQLTESWAQGTGAASAPSQVTPAGTHSSGGGARQPGSGPYLGGVQSSAGSPPPQSAHQSNDVNYWPPGAPRAPNQVPTGVHLSSSAPGAGSFGLAKLPDPGKGAPTTKGQHGGLPHSFGQAPTPVGHTVPFGARGGKRAPLPPHLLYTQAPPPPPATAGFAPGSAYPQHSHPHTVPLFKGGAQNVPSPAVLAAQNQFASQPPVQEDIVNPVLPKAPEGETMVENLCIGMLLKDLSDSELVALSSVLMSQYPLFAEYVEKKILFKKNYVAQKRHQSALGNLGDRTAMSAPAPDVNKNLGKVASDFVREVQLNPEAISPNSITPFLCEVDALTSPLVTEVEKARFLHKLRKSTMHATLARLRVEALMCRIVEGHSPSCEVAEALQAVRGFQLEHRQALQLVAHQEQVIEGKDQTILTMAEVINTKTQENRNLRNEVNRLIRMDELGAETSTGPLWSNAPLSVTTEVASSSTGSWLYDDASVSIISDD